MVICGMKNAIAEIRNLTHSKQSSWKMIDKTDLMQIS